MVVLAFTINLLCAGCGTGVTVVAAMESPTISQVSPQVVTAGTPSVTVTVQGTNFQSQAALTVNGTAVPTTVVNSTTIAANISGSPLALPAVAQLQVKNSNGGASNQVSFTVTTAPNSQNALSITTTQLPSAKVGVSYKVSLGAAGGAQPYKWSVSSGSLPSGLTMSSGGVISGTPSVSGTFSFSVTVTDSASKTQSKTVTFSIVVTAAQSAATALSISSAALSSGQVASTYAVSLSASGGTPGYTWSMASGGLPAGLALSSAGVISGTPTASGTSTFTVAVKDSGSPVQTASASESITVSAAPSKVTITTTSLAAGKSGSSYSASLSASGGTPGYTWSIVSGSLPAGLALSSAGVISGTPTGSGTSTFTVGVHDSASPAQMASVQESITVSAAASTLTITSTSLSAAQTGTSYNATLSANGGTPGYTWTVSAGKLPVGLSLSSGGVITGTPTKTGTASFTVTVTDSASPAQTASASESIAVGTTPVPLAITTTSLATGKSGSSYSTSLSASGGTPGYTWSVKSGNLPAGLSLSSAGQISGTPTASGTFTFTVGVQDSASPAQTASASESITVSAATSTLTITSTSLAAGKNGSSYSATLSASGGTPGYAWSIASGSLPAGLSLSSGGVISGTPTANGTANFTVTVTDSASPTQTASASESIAVSAAPSTLTITSTSLGAAQTGSTYSTTLNASGGTPGYTWAVSAGSLPAGLSLSSAGVISGTPTGTGSSNFTVTVTDSASPAQTASAQESITVASSQLAITTVSLGAGSTGTGYSVTLAASGGTPSYTWSVTSGSLPAGLSLSSAGVISGTPTAAGSSSFTVSVSDSGSPAQTATQQESITVNTYNATPGSPQIYVYPQAPVAPRGSYQTVTAVVTGVNDKTVTWTADGGTIVGTNPCVVNEPCTVALYTTTPGTYHLTATSNANNSLAAASTITITQSPAAVTTHPRLLITAAMLPDLRAKAVSSNPMYQSIRNTAISLYTADNAVWSWSCNSGSGLPSSFQSGKEYDARFFAYMALVDPSDPTYNWGCYGRDTWTYAMTQVLNGNEPIIGNTWSDTSVNFAFDTDWLMGSGSLSTADQTLARQFLAYLGQTILGYYYGITPPVSGYNSTSLTGNNIGNMRAMGNNYTESKLMLMAAIGLTFNDTTSDDPALSNSCGATRYQLCSDYSAGSLHAFWSYFDGSMLYLDWAHLDDPGVTWRAYQSAYSNVSSPPTCLYTDGSSHACFGDSRDGASSEGSWYQYSMYKLRYALNMMHTAGYDDPTLYGPQVSLGTSSWWDMKYVHDLEFMTSMNANNGPAGGGCAGCISPAYSYLTTGDSNTYYRTPADMYTEAAMLSADSYVGRADRTPALEWMVLDTAYGGANGSQGGCNTWCGFDSALASSATGGPLAIDLMISLPASDPVSSPPSDPRPSLPTDIYNGSYAQQQILRSGWTGNTTLFSFYCTNALIDHEHENCGRFDIYSNGEYITKGRTEFDDYNEVMSTSPQSNEASYLNTTGSGCGTGCFVQPSVQYGGEFTHGQQQGIVSSLVHSELPTYAAATVDDTLAYNGWWAYSSPYDVSSYNDVQYASRDVLYLRGSNQVVFYDRGVTGSASDKSVSLITTGATSVNANTASWPTQSGTQKAYYTALLPTQGSLSNAGLLAGGPDQVSDWEPVSSIREDAGAVSTAQFLSVLQWGGSSFAPSSTTLVQSTSGQNFDGALVGSSLTMFMRTWPASFTGVVYPASGATTQFVLDLTPNTTYSITGAGAPATATTDTAGVLTFSAAGTGSITVASSH